MPKGRTSSNDVGHLQRVDIDIEVDSLERDKEERYMST